MLRLKRKVGETIVVGNNVKITFLGNDGRRAIFGIEAPRDVPIHRLEVLEARERELLRLADDGCPHAEGE